MRSRDPSATSSTARALSAHTLAASEPWATSTDSPRVPRQVSSPAIRGSCPEVRATPSWTTTASNGSCGGWGPWRTRPSSSILARTPSDIGASYGQDSSGRQLRSLGTSSTGDTGTVGAHGPDLVIDLNADV